MEKGREKKGVKRKRLENERKEEIEELNVSRPQLAVGSVAQPDKAGKEGVKVIVSDWEYKGIYIFSDFYYIFH